MAVLKTHSPYVGTVVSVIGHKQEDSLLFDLVDQASTHHIIWIDSAHAPGSISRVGQPWGI